MKPYISSREGLPTWLLLVSRILLPIFSYHTADRFARHLSSGLFQSFKAYTASLSAGATQIEAARSTRKCGTWTLLSRVVRVYGAFCIDKREVYEFAMWTCALAFAHFAAGRSIYGDQV